MSTEELHGADVVSAAMEGYCVPEETAQETSVESEEIVLTGDVDKLSEKQKAVMMQLKECSAYPKFKVKQVSLSFSGAAVFFFSPIRKDGTPMPSSVLKFDTEENVKDEIGKTQSYAPKYGLTTPKVKESQFLADSTPEEPCSVMQIDLCGGVFGLPEFATAPPVRTFASVIETELHSEQKQVDIVPLVNEALERRMFNFTMSNRSVNKVQLSSMYKLVRFVGHGVLNRAAEGAKRSKKSPALAAGFLNPRDIDELDPQGKFLTELIGERKSMKAYFSDFVKHEKRFNSNFEREVVLGLCHNDLHGGNLLLDSQGLVWLIDFATVKDDTHVLMDLAKFLASCLFLYLHDGVAEENLHTFAKLLATTPDATTALPEVGDEGLKTNVAYACVLNLLTRLRHCMCLYETGDDAPTNDGTPFALALFSWSTRMLSYSEPTLKQKTRAVYFSIAAANRILLDIGIDIGSTASTWIEDFRGIWEGQKGRRLSTSTSQVQVLSFKFDLEYPRYLAQVGTSEAWSTDFLTRERVHVTDHCIVVTLKFLGKTTPKYTRLQEKTKKMLKLMQQITDKYVPWSSFGQIFSGRLFIIGGSGTGKTMLTRQLFSEVAQKQVVNLRAESGTEAKPEIIIVPVRLPLVDLGRMLEAEPDKSLVADPINDMIIQWMEQKYGQDSVPQKVISDVRGTCLSARASRRSSLKSSLSEEQYIEPDDEAVEEASDASFSGLLLLLDGLDEATTFKAALLEYVESLVKLEPTHLMFLTSRPSNISASDVKLLSDLSFSSLAMDVLDLQQASQLLRSALTRLGDSEADQEAIISAIGNPRYASLREIPLVLTLLMYVVRKSLRRADATGPDSRAPPVAVVMKKTEVYQRAVRLILHQSDAAKFAMRQGTSDQNMVRRLEMLKSIRARKLFQSISWASHGLKAREWSWSTLGTASTDAEMVSVLKEAFEQGRMPILEKLESVSDGAKLQFTHLSFQELLCGEYASAIVQHASACNQLRSYMNYFLSTSSKTASRDRLSDVWWIQVWFHVCEMVQASTFKEWCNVLAEDEQTHLKIGSTGYSIQVYNGTRYEFYYRAESINWDERTCAAKYIGNEPPTCLGPPVSWPKHIGKFPLDFVHLNWRADGVATLLGYAVKGPYHDLVETLLDRKVHIGCEDADGMSILVKCLQVHNSDMWKLMGDRKATFPNCAHPLQKTCFIEGALSFPGAVETLNCTTGVQELKSMKPCGVMEQALEGSLHASPDIDPNYTDPTSQLTLLMVAAAKGNSQLVSELLANQANVNAETSQGSTALTFAAECCRGKSSAECLELLIAAKADVHRVSTTLGPPFWNDMNRWIGSDNPPSFGVASNDSRQGADVLHAAGLSFAKGNPSAQSPALVAAFFSSVEVLSLALDDGANPCIVRPCPYILVTISPMHALIPTIAISSIHPAAMGMMMDKGFVTANESVPFYGFQLMVGYHYGSRDPGVACGDWSCMDTWYSAGLGTKSPRHPLTRTNVLHLPAMVPGCWYSLPIVMRMLEDKHDLNGKSLFGTPLNLAKKTKNQAFLDVLADFRAMQDDKGQ